MYLLGISLPFPCYILQQPHGIKTSHSSEADIVYHTEGKVLTNSILSSTKSVKCDMKTGCSRAAELFI